MMQGILCYNVESVTNVWLARLLELRIYQTTFHLEGLDLDNVQGILEELCLVIGGWRWSRHGVYSVVCE